MSKIQYRFTILTALLFVATNAWAQSQSPTIHGNVYGGGRMAAVTNTVGHTNSTTDAATNTCTIDIYKGTIDGNVFGGNDITGDVRQPRYNADGTYNASSSSQREGDHSTMVTIHNTCAEKIKIGEVYGGGNGYYTYCFTYYPIGQSSGSYNYEINAATLDANPNFQWLFTQKAPDGGLEVKVYPATSTEYNDANLVATYTVPAGTSLTNVIPIAHNTHVTVGDAVLADNIQDKILLGEVYGGAKMAWVSGEGEVTVNSGTINKLFAGNNWGGVVYHTKMTINGTKKPSTLATTDNFASFDWANAGKWEDTEGNGWGIGEAYGGGNAVDVQNSTNVFMNDGYVKTLFGGNNLADMSSVPEVHLNGGNLQTVYGGGNAGAMKGCSAGAIDVSQYLDNTLFLAYDNVTPFTSFNDGTNGFSTYCSNDSYLFFYGAETLVHQKSDDTPLRIGNVYGGCRAADVLLSTYVRLSKAAYLGNVYGGCDISGSVAKGGAATGTTIVGETYVTTAAMNVEQYNATTGDAHAVVKTVPANFPIINLASMVTMTGGTTSGNMFAGGNGDYTYTENGDKVEVTDAAGALLATISNSDYYRPWVAHSVAALEGGNLLGNLYGGGNNATVGRPAAGVETADTEGRAYVFLGKTARGDNDPTTGTNSAIYAGGKKSDVYGTVDVIVKAGCNLNALYAGNDISGQIKGTNRTNFLGSAGTLTTPLYGGGTTYSGQPLTAPYGDSDRAVQSYVRVEEGAKIQNLFGGGNGDYDYTTTTSPYYELTKPTQHSCWLDIKGDVTTSYGGGNAAEVGFANTYITENAHVTTAFGGGNSATATMGVNMWVNCNGTKKAESTDPDFDNPNVGTVFGGNNLAAMDIVPRVHLWGGTIGTSYGGGNAGAMRGVQPAQLDISAYLNNELFAAYPAPISTYCKSDAYLYFYGAETIVEEKDNTKPLSVKSVYGGCRAANVLTSTYVRVTKPSYVGTVYGGCDIAGSVGKGNPSMPVTTKEMPIESYVITDPNDPAHAVQSNLPANFPIINLASHITITAGTISGDCFGGGNGDYDYVTDGNTVSVYNIGVAKTAENLLASFDKTVTDMPWVKNAIAAMEGGLVTGNIYGGGNNATVGTTEEPGRAYVLIGKTRRGVLATDATGPVCTGTIYAGGKKADVNGTVDLLVKSGSRVTTLFAGNDISGEVRGTNRAVYANANGVAITTPLIGGSNTYNDTHLDEVHCQTYVRIEGMGNDCDNTERPAAYIGTLFGGGNGDYDYASDDSPYKGLAKPVQESCWLDIKGDVVTSYGGGNAANVAISNTYITGNATVGKAFAGGNSATITETANLWLDCDGTRGTQDYVDGIDNSKIPNVGTIFGGNNIADMNIVPKVKLWRGSVQTVYGGGNQGNMKGVRPYLVDLKEYVSGGWFTGSYPVYSSDKVLCFKGTNLVIDSPYEKNNDNTLTGNPCKLVIGDVYAGCRAANVDNSSYVRVSHCDYIDNIYGGCDIAGSVGMYPGYFPSDSPYRDAAQGGKVKFYYINSDDFVLNEEYKEIPTDAPMVNPTSCVLFTGGMVSGNIYGSGNGAYEYVENGNTVNVYNFGALQTDANLLASYDKTKMTKPFTTVTTVAVSGGTVNGNVYGGGNMAEVGHIVTTEDVAMHTAAGYTSSGDGYRLFPSWTLGGTTVPEHIVKVDDEISAISNIFLGRAQIGRSDVVINGDVYGGGRMADVYGSMDIIALKDVNIGTLYAGNDIAGTVKGSSRVSRFTPNTNFTTLIASEDNSSTKLATSFTGETLTAENANTYIRIMPGATFETIFGGGNGDYTYTSNGDGTVTIKSKDGTVTYGKVTAASVDAAKPSVHSSFIDVAGNANTVYGGGNAANNDYTNVCIMGEAKIGTSSTPGAVYGGCKSADVNHRTNVTVASFTPQGGTKVSPTINGNVFGGCDISGNVGMGDASYKGRLDIDNPGTIGYAKVTVNGATITGRVFGGGNGLQSASGTAYYMADASAANNGLTMVDTAPDESYQYPASSTYAGKTLPQVENTWLTLQGCTIGTTQGSETHTIFGGGQGAGTRVIHNVELHVGDGTNRSTVQTLVNGISYGGSYAGLVNTDCDDHTRTKLLGYELNTQIKGDVYGGSYGNSVRGKILVDVNGVKVGVSEASPAGIYAGNNAAGQSECEASINYVGDDCNVTLYGGSNEAPFYGTTRITFTTGKVGYIYGGGNHAPVYGNTIVEILGGEVCHDVFGGGNEGGIFVNKATDTEHNSYGKDYGGNTLVIVRDDCLELGPDAAGKNPGEDGYVATFKADALTGNRFANRGTTSYFNTNADETAMSIENEVDPYTSGKQMYILKPNGNSPETCKKSTIEIGGNVFGGGNAADVEGKATVIIGNKQMSE